MRSVLIVLLSLTCIFATTVVVDRIAAIVGKKVIKLSDVLRDLRVTAFLNRQPVDLGANTRRKATERLVDQQIIRQEISSQGYSRPSNTDADTLLTQIVRDRFHGSDVQLQNALQQYGLTKDELHEQLLWQLTVLRFIDQRFRPGILVTDEDVQAYYNAHLSDLRREYPKDSSFAALAPRIRTSLEGTRIDQEFDSWLDQSRKGDRIEYKEAAFQ